MRAKTTVTLKSRAIQTPSAALPLASRTYMVHRTIFWLEPVQVDGQVHLGLSTLSGFRLFLPDVQPIREVTHVHCFVFSLHIYAVSGPSVARGKSRLCTYVSIYRREVRP